MMSPDSSFRNAPVFYGILTVFVGLFWAIFVLYVALGALPFNPIRPPLLESIRTQLWMPEGWGFFTRNPREDRILLYAFQNETWQSAALSPLGQPRYAMGLDRAPRAQGVEMALLLAVPALQKSWTSCRVDPVRCLSQQSTSKKTIKNRSPNPSLCGLIGFVTQAPIPWAWVNSPKPVVMPSNTARVEVVC
jgi:antimicrobial peptide system SdpA family protein